MSVSTESDSRKTIRRGAASNFTFGYVVGAAFSGSTLLALLLDGLPGVASVGEVFDPIYDEGELYACSCGRTVAACPFWAAVSGEMSRRGFKFDGDNWQTEFGFRGHRLLNRVTVASLQSIALDRIRDALVARVPPARRRLRTIGARNLALAETVLTVTGKSIFVDTSKAPRRAVLLKQHSGVQPRLIHLIRDAPGYVNSTRKHTGASIDQGILEWRRVARQARLLRTQLHSHPWLDVQYEDLCREPATTMKRIADFLGTTFTDKALAFREHDHHIRGNSMRLQTSSDIRLDSSWRTELDGPSLRRILSRTARLRQQFGYV